ncbi:MAG: methyl-accepting chemotaxis protein [Mariprofundaceae bacterium]
MKDMLLSMRNMSVVGMLRAGFISLGVIVLAVVAVIWSNNQQLVHDMDSFHDIELRAMKHAQEVRYQLVQVQQLITDAALTGNDEAKQEADRAADAVLKELDSTKTLLERERDKKDVSDMLNRIRSIESNFGGFRSVGYRMIDIYIDQGREAGNQVMEEFDGVAATVGDEIENLFVHVEKMMVASLEKDIAEVHLIQKLLLLLVVVLLLASIATYVFVIRGFSARLTPVVDALNEWAVGSLEPRIIHIKGKGQLAEMSWSVNAFADKVETLLREIVASLDAMADGDLNRRVDLRTLSTEMVRVGGVVNNALEQMAATQRKAISDAERTVLFQSEIGEVVNKLEQVAADSTERAHTVAAMAEESSTQAANVSEGAQDAAGNVTTVAAAAEELSASIAEVSRQVKEAVDVANQAAIEAEKTTEEVEQLSKVSEDIGSVVGLISDIAEQTNLLALNASIEAARAGDAGRGFAVVAGEVKQLAGETSKATDRISGLINSIQKESKDAAVAIEGISKIIFRIRDINSDIDAAAEEQNSAAHEIAHSIQTASQSVVDVTNNIEGVATAADETGQSSAAMMESAEELNHTAAALSGEVDNFLGDVGIKK